MCTAGSSQLDEYSNDTLLSYNLLFHITPLERPSPIMKTVLVFATLFFAPAILVAAKPHPPELPPQIKAAHDVCMEKLGVTREQLQEKRKNGANEKEDCFRACVDKELGILTADGKIDKEMAVKDFPPHIPKENATSIVEACFEQKGSSDCETAALYHNCVKKLAPRPPMHPELQKIHDDCKSKLKLSDEDLEKMEREEEKLKENCFFACVGKKVGFMNEDGSLNEKALVEKSPPFVKKEEAAKVAEMCGKQKGANECESAVMIHRCLRDNDFKFSHRHGPHPAMPQ
ncbi:uncharacterized protein [Neodiprion pinetum]|uniref:uncharacterized protein n=1 Tax=Neodiprion pinetum TaxID=441929 RepID=UPI001EDE47C0|nr:uncharacterized protein LOC124221719 [Neodiprion pinetum]